MKHLVDRVPEESVFLVLDDVRLRTAIDDDRDASRRHRFDRGNTEMFSELRMRVRILTKTRGVPENASAAIELFDPCAGQVCFDQSRGSLGGSPHAVEVVVILLTCVQPAY